MLKEKLISTLHVVRKTNINVTCWKKN